MPIKKKKAAAKSRKTSAINGLAKYRAKVKKATAPLSRMIKKAEARLKLLKKKKAAKVKKIKK
jgi:hypothetical protein